MLDPQVLAELTEALGPQGLSADLVDRLACSHDTYPLALKLADSDQTPFLPDLVVFPKDTRQVAAVVRIAAAHRVPLFAYGGGSGIVGGALASPGGITLELKGLSGIVAFDPLSNLVTAEAGTNGQLLEDALNARGRTLGHYPQSLRSSTPGGWVAHRATGTASTLYGGIEQLVAGLEVVLPNGEILDLHASPRSATGPDLRQLFLGSEGTLGVITRVTLRVFPLPRERRWLAFTFAGFAAGLDAIRQVVQAGYRPAVVRLYDEIEGAHLLESSGLPAGRVPQCLLIASCEGDPERVAFESAQIGAALRRSAGSPIPPDPAERWWRGRFNTRGLLASLRAPLGIADALEVSAPWRLLPDLYGRMRARMEAALGLPDRPGQVYGHCSHVYPDGGNLYMIFHGQAEDPASLPDLYQAVLRAAFEACADAGGSLSHHHGIGLGKARWLGLELGPAGLDALRAVQQALDPQAILNPGKLGARTDA